MRGNGVGVPHGGVRRLAGRLAQRVVAGDEPGGVVTEKVWFNFEPDRAHWASLAGRDLTHRQTVKRKAAGLGAALPGHADGGAPGGAGGDHGG